MPKRDELSPLEEAAEKGNLEEVKRLQATEQATLSLLAKFNTEYPGRVTSEELKQLNDEGYRHLANKLREQISALKLAASRGHVEVVKALLESDALKMTDRATRMCGTSGTIFDGIYEALTSAIFNDHVEIVRLLLKHGLRADHSNNNNLRPLACAAQLARIKIVDELLKDSNAVAAINFPEDKDDTTPLILIASVNPKFKNDEENTLAVMNALLKHGANIDAQNSQEETALIVAVIKNYVETVDTLLNHGADVNKRDRNEKTALMHAVKIGTAEIVGKLLAKKAEIDPSISEHPLIKAHLQKVEDKPKEEKAFFDTSKKPDSPKITQVEEQPVTDKFEALSLKDPQSKEKSAEEKAFFDKPLASKSSQAEDKPKKSQSLAEKTLTFVGQLFGF